MSAITDDDPILDTLLLPLQNGMVLRPDSATAFLRARDGQALRQCALDHLRCEQTFKPDADALAAAGFDVSRSVDGRYALVLVLPPRQRDEARALLARAVAMTAPGGCVLACQSNNEGARSMADDLARLAGPVNTLVKHKCRAVWVCLDDGSINPALAAQWQALDAPQRVVDGRFLSRPGVFAWDRIDAASELLATHLPETLAGSAADLGAGFGYLSTELLARCPRIRSLDVYEAEARALDLARENLASFESRVSIEHHWRDVTRGLTKKHDVIVTNPPFHTTQRHDRPDIGRRFIAIAAAALKPDGRLWLVANRHLPYESVLNASFGQVRTVTQSGGYKIVEAIRAGSR